MNNSELSSRLIPLSDGRPGLRGSMPVEVRDSSHPSDSSDTLDFIASDETLDRCNEIIVASGWNLSSYRRNPVFQNAHQHGDIIFTLGRALLTEVRAGKLFQRVKFATDVNPMAKVAYGLYRGKFLNAVSVGFIPVRWENGGPDTAFSRRYLEQELLEVSAVAIPANPHALALAFKSGAVERADLSDLADLIHQTLDTSEGAVAAAVAGGAALASTPASSIQVQSLTTAKYARLMSLALQLHDLLKHS